MSYWEISKREPLMTLRQQLKSHTPLLNVVKYPSPKRAKYLLKVVGLLIEHKSALARDMTRKMARLKLRHLGSHRHSELGGLWFEFLNLY